MELDRDGGAPRVILDNVSMPNAFERWAPTASTYFPVMGTNEIWRVGLDSGPHEIVARDLDLPDSVKFDRHGNIVSTQAASGQVLRIDPRTGERTVLATIAPGLDNCTFVGTSALFRCRVFPGRSAEVLRRMGKSGPLVPDGLQWPLGLAIDDDPHALSLLTRSRIHLYASPGFRSARSGHAYSLTWLSRIHAWRSRQSDAAAFGS